MKRLHFVVGMGVVCVLSLVSLFVACEGGEYVVEVSGSGASATGEAGTLNGFVRDFQTKTEVQDALVELVNNVTGEPFDPPVTATSPASGEVSFELPEGITKVGVLVKKDGATDTVQFDFAEGLEGEEFLLISNATRDLVALGLGLQPDCAAVTDDTPCLDLTKAVTAGGMYWGDPIDENPIGCGVISFQPDDGQGVFYFGNDALPNAARNVTGDTPANGQGTNPGRDGKGQAISYYVSLNKEIEYPLLITGRTFEAEGSGTLDASQGSANVMPRVYPGTATIQNVYFSKGDFTEDPTPSWCTQ